MTEKQRGWYTAFYYFAEHIRILTNGAVNHKQTYSYVGENPQYINNDNPTIRKRTAAALSRLMHSSKYAEEMRSQHRDNPGVFADAATILSRSIQEKGSFGTDELYAYFRDVVWSDIEIGLENERDSGRAELNMKQLDLEMTAFMRQDLNSIMQLTANDNSPDPRAADSSTLAFARMGVMPPRYCESIIATILYVMAYGHLDKELMHSLTDKTPTMSFEPVKANLPDPTERVCIVRLGNMSSYSVGGIWEIDPEETFTIGRYTDCNAIDADPSISRLHCKIYREEDEWILEDMGSSNGTRVIGKDGELLYDSQVQGSHDKTTIHMGDRILLAKAICFWFGALNE